VVWLWWLLAWALLSVPLGCAVGEVLHAMGEGESWDD